MEKLELMKYFESVTFAQELGIEKKDKRLWLGPDFCNFYVLFICQSFRYSGFQSSSSKLLIYTSQKERISFSSPAKKLS